MIEVTNLPSKNLLGYEIEKMQPFKFAEISLASSAIASEYYGFMVKAIDNVIKADANIISTGDLFYLQILQRLKAYTTPLYAEFICDYTVYRDSEGNIYNDEKLKSLVANYDGNGPDPKNVKVETLICNHPNSSTVAESDLSVIEIQKVPEADSFFDIPRAGIYADVLALNKDSKLRHIAPIAHWLRDGITLADKLETLEKQEDLSLFEKLVSVSNDSRYLHGVRGSIVKTCDKCGNKTEIPLEITPSLFLLG